jgi:hypothetical protein
MSGKIRNLLNRDGRYFVRLTVPKELRATIGKRELRISLGADRRGALQKHPRAVAKLLDELAKARMSLGNGKAPPRLLSRAELAHLHYDEMLDRDEQARNIPVELSGVSVPSINALFSDARLDALRRIASGDAETEEIALWSG